MDERESQIRELVSDILTYEPVDDAFLAKSFTDRLLILDITADDGVPDEIVTRLNEFDFYAADSVYATSSTHTSGVGNTGDVTRHHFVDTETRGSHQSYVLE